MKRSDLPITNIIFREPYKSGVSAEGKLLFVTLSELRNLFCKGKDWFFISDDELAELTDYSVSTVKKYKKELKEAGLIHTFKNASTKTGYRLIEHREYKGFYFKRK